MHNDVVIEGLCKQVKACGSEVGMKRAMSVSAVPLSKFSIENSLEAEKVLNHIVCYFVISFYSSPGLKVFVKLIRICDELMPVVEYDISDLVCCRISSIC